MPFHVEKVDDHRFAVVDSNGKAAEYQDEEWAAKNRAEHLNELEADLIEGGFGGFIN